MEKMQESNNKNLKEWKNKHTETNNTIAKIKNTPEGINSRISEAEEEISELEDKMVEIMKRIEDSLRDLWDNIKCTNVWIRKVSEEEEKKKGYEKIFEGIIVESQLSPRGTKSPIQDKPKEKHAKTYTNPTNKN